MPALRAFVFLALAGRVLALLESAGHEGAVHQSSATDAVAIREQAGQQAGRQAALQAAQQTAGQAAGQAAQQSAGQAASQAAQHAAQHAAQQTAGQAANHQESAGQVAQQTARQAVQQAAQQTAQQAAQQTAEQAAQQTAQQAAQQAAGQVAGQAAGQAANQAAQQSAGQVAQQTAQQTGKAGMEASLQEFVAKARNLRGRSRGSQIRQLAKKFEGVGCKYDGEAGDELHDPDGAIEHFTACVRKLEGLAQQTMAMAETRGDLAQEYGKSTKDSLGVMNQAVRDINSLHRSIVTEHKVASDHLATQVHQIQDQLEGIAESNQAVHGASEAAAGGAAAGPWENEVHHDWGDEEADVETYRTEDGWQDDEPGFHHDYDPWGEKDKEAKEAAEHWDEEEPIPHGEAPPAYEDLYPNANAPLWGPRPPPSAELQVEQKAGGENDAAGQLRQIHEELSALSRRVSGLTAAQAKREAP